MLGVDSFGRFSIFSQFITRQPPGPPTIANWTKPFSTISAGSAIGYPNVFDFSLVPTDDVRLVVERGVIIGPKTNNPEQSNEDTPQSIYFGRTTSAGSPTPTAQTSEIRNWNTNITILPGIKDSVVGTVTIESDLYVNGNINVTGCIIYNGGTLGTCI